MWLFVRGPQTHVAHRCGFLKRKVHTWARRGVRQTAGAFHWQRSSRHWGLLVERPGRTAKRTSKREEYCHTWGDLAKTLVSPVQYSSCDALLHKFCNSQGCCSIQVALYDKSIKKYCKQYRFVVTLFRLPAKSWLPDGVWEEEPPSVWSEVQG